MNQTMAINGTFSKPTKHFTQISNQVLRDNTLSLRAKGLFALIASYITLPGFTLYKKYIQSQCSEGRCAFDTAWKELQEAGYLTHKRVRGENGTFSYEYKLALVDSEAPASVPNEKFYINATNQKNRDTNVINSKYSVTKTPIPEYQPPVLLYSINKTLTKNTQSVQQTRQDLEQQLDWNYFQQDNSFSGPPVNAINMLIDYISLEKEKAYVNQSVLSLEQISRIDSSTMCEFLEHMKKQAPKKVRLPTAYWTTAFSNYIKEKDLHLCFI